MEKILCMVGVKKGIFKTYYRLIFTDQRIIQAVTVSSTSTASKYVPTTLAGGFLLGSSVGNYMNDRMEKKVIEELKKLDPEDILKLDESNFSIPYSNIKKILMEKFRHFHDGKITIFTTEKDYSYELRFESMFDKWVNLVKTVIPDKLEVK